MRPNLHVNERCTFSSGERNYFIHYSFNCDLAVVIRIIVSKKCWEIVCQGCFFKWEAPLSFGEREM